MVEVIPNPQTDRTTLDAAYTNMPKKERGAWLLFQLVKQLIEVKEELQDINRHLENGVTVYTGSL